MTTKFENLHGVAMTLGAIGLVGIAGLVGRRGSTNANKRVIEFGEYGDDFGLWIIYADDGTVDRFYVVDGRDVSAFFHQPSKAPDASKPWSRRATKLSSKPSSLEEGMGNAVSALAAAVPEWVDWTDIPSTELIFA